MARMLISAEGTVAAPAETVYRYIADMREHHPHFAAGVLGLGSSPAARVIFIGTLAG